MREKFDFFNRLCLCGSGKEYEECCKIKIDISKEKSLFKSYMQEFDRMHNSYKKICVHPKQHECSDVKTHAHTISKKAVLELIAENGIVLMPIAFGITNEFRMKPLGIEAKATKFYCFCSKHDGMFAPIDEQDAEFTEYNCFLYAYRIFASTYYKIERELGCYYKLREKYNLTSNPFAILMYKQMEVNKNFLEEHKKTFDKAIRTESYDFFESIKITLDYRVCFAAATCFCPMIDAYGNALTNEGTALPLVYVSVIPNDKCTNIIFSWSKENHSQYSLLKEQLNIAPRRLLMKYINNLLPLNCENITVSPKLWDMWGEYGQADFINLAHLHLRDESIKYLSNEYFEDRKYNLFLQLTT